MRTKPPSRTTTRAANMSNRQPARRPLGPTKISFKPDGGEGLFWEGSVGNRGESSTAFSMLGGVIGFLSLFSHEVPRNQNQVDHRYRQNDCQQIPAPDVVDKIAVAEKNVGNDETD